MKRHGHASLCRASVVGDLDSTRQRMSATALWGKPTQCKVFQAHPEPPTGFWLRSLGRCPLASHTGFGPDVRSRTARPRRQIRVSAGRFSCKRLLASSFPESKSSNADAQGPKVRAIFGTGALVMTCPSSYLWASSVVDTRRLEAWNVGNRPVAMSDQASLPELLPPEEGENLLSACSVLPGRHRHQQPLRLPPHPSVPLQRSTCLPVEANPFHPFRDGH